VPGRSTGQIFCAHFLRSKRLDAIWMKIRNALFATRADYHLARERLEFFGGDFGRRGPIGRFDGSFYAMMKRNA
jgi:hypothetical protein